MAYIYINVIQSINYLKFHEEIHTFLLFLDRRWLNCKHDGSSRTAPGYRKHFVELEGDISRVYLFVRGRERIMMFTARGRDNCEEEARNVFSIVSCGEQVVREAFSSALRRNMEEIALKMRSWKVSFLMCNFLLFSFYMIVIW